MVVELPYGRRPLRFDGRDRDIEVIRPVPLPAPGPVATLLEAALDAPIESAPLETLVTTGARVTLIVSDSTRA